jgi:hypothetical protein
MLKTLISLGMMLGVATATPFEFTSMTTGNYSGYNHASPGVAPRWKNDASGAARVGVLNIMVDDLLSSVRVWNAFQDEATYGVNVQLPSNHKDLEGATQIADGTQLLITCSMSDPVNNDFNRLTRYDVNQHDMTLHNEKSVFMRGAIMNALNATLGREDPAWFSRIQLYESKNGNLNIEGISVTGPESDYDFVWGVRGPLFSPQFATFAGSGQILDVGKAILVYAKNVFDDASCAPEFRVETIDLEGKGVRSIEYIPALKGYVISSGPVPKADEYGLWLYRPAFNGKRAELINLESQLSEFHNLGRPEGILREPNNYFSIISEDDPTFTTPKPYNWIRVHVDDVDQSCPLVPRCQVTVTSTVTSSWVSNGVRISQYNVAIHNPTASTASSISFKVSSGDAARIQSVWNLNNNGNGVYTLPTWSNTIAAGASYTSAGYISSNGPVHFDIETVAC